MDSNHATGCSLIGMAFTALLMRLFWMSSPPFTQMGGGRLKAVKITLVAVTVLGLTAGAIYLSQPSNESAAAKVAEEGFRFH